MYTSAQWLDANIEELAREYAEELEDMGTAEFDSNFPLPFKEWAEDRYKTALRETTELLSTV